MLTFGQAGNRADDLAGTSHSLRSSCPRLTCCVQRPGPCYVPCTTTPRCTLLSPASTSSLSSRPLSLAGHVACVVCSPSTTWTGTHTKASCCRVGRTARSSTPKLCPSCSDPVLRSDLAEHCHTDFSTAPKLATRSQMPASRCADVTRGSDAEGALISGTCPALRTRTTSFRPRSIRLATSSWREPITTWSEHSRSSPSLLQPFAVSHAVVADRHICTTPSRCNASRRQSPRATTQAASTRCAARQTASSTPLPARTERSGCGTS